MAHPPPISYVECDGHDVAFQATGDGSSDLALVVVLDIGAHLDLMWTDPEWANQFERFGSAGRIALFQMRGIGLSEPVAVRPTLEEQARDIEMVMDAAGIERASIRGTVSTAPGAVAFAARCPERVQALVLLNPMLSGPLADAPDLTGWGRVRRRRTPSAGWPPWSDGDRVAWWTRGTRS